MGYTFSTGGGVGGGFNNRSLNNANQIVMGTWMLDFIQPDMKGVHIKYKKLSIIFGCMIPVCMILFIALPVIQTTAMRGNGFPFLVLPPFLGFAAFGILTGVYSANTYKAKLILDVVTEVSAKDKTTIANLSVSQKMGANFGFLLVKKLIDTQNILGFSTFGEIGVYRNGISVSESDFAAFTGGAQQTVIIQQPAPATPARPSKCPSCGAGLRNENFCPFCGTKI